MVYKRTYRKKGAGRRRPNRKGTNKRYRRKYKRSANTSFQKQLVIADRTFAKVKYSETELTRTVMSLPVGSNYTLQTYFGNCLTQHYPGGITTMPGLQQWGAFYARYRVHAIKVKVAMVSNDATSTGSSNRPLMGFIHLQSDPAPSSFSSWAQIRNFNGNRYSVFKPLAITESGGQTTTTYLKRFYRFGPITGNKLAYKVDDTYEGTFGSVPGGGGAVAPGRLFNYYIGLMTMDSSLVTGAPQQVSMMLTTTLYCEFKDRIDSNGGP